MDMAKISTDPKKINEILTRGVERIYPSTEALEKLLRSGKRIHLYLGIDPSGPKLHLGHAITLRKLSQFQALGHEVIMLIGDFTGMIGDPTDKTATRQKLSRKEVRDNSLNYKKWAGKFLSFSGPNSARLEYNSTWSDKLTFLDLIEITSNLTVQQMIGRDMFQERIKNGKPIHLHEFLYPVAQGYDSVAMDIDLELGGNDQTFNMLVGRDLMKALSGKEKFVLSMKLLTDPSGKKMGKSEGNMVTMADSAADMFGKIMSWPDERIPVAFELLTDISEKEIQAIGADLKKGSVNPKELKIRLAKDIASFYHDKPAAEKASQDFDRVFKSHGLPTDIPLVTFPLKPIPLLDLLTKTKLSSSKSDAQRLIAQGALKIDGAVEKDWKKTISPRSGMVIQVGKRRFAKIK